MFEEAREIEAFHQLGQLVHELCVALRVLIRRELTPLTHELEGLWAFWSVDTPSGEDLQRSVITPLLLFVKQDLLSHISARRKLRLARSRVPFSLSLGKLKPEQWQQVVERVRLVQPGVPWLCQADPHEQVLLFWELRWWVAHRLRARLQRDAGFSEQRHSIEAVRLQEPTEERWAQLARLFAYARHGTDPQSLENFDLYALLSFLSTYQCYTIPVQRAQVRPIFGMSYKGIGHKLGSQRPVPESQVGEFLQQCLQVPEVQVEALLDRARQAGGREVRIPLEDFQRLLGDTQEEDEEALRQQYLSDLTDRLARFPFLEGLEVNVAQATHSGWALQELQNHRLDVEPTQEPYLGVDWLRRVDSPEALVVVGVAGQGKSTLLRHLAWWWTREGTAVGVLVRADCLYDALQRGPGGVTAEVIAEASVHTLRALGGFVPEDWHHQVEVLVGSVGVVLLVDALDEVVDFDSRDQLRCQLEGMAATRPEWLHRLLVTSRPGAVELSQQSTMTCLQLLPLQGEARQEFIRDLVERWRPEQMPMLAFLEQHLSLTGIQAGNPLLLSMMVATLTRDGVPERYNSNRYGLYQRLLTHLVERAAGRHNATYRRWLADVCTLVGALMHAISVDGAAIGYHELLDRLTPLLPPAAPVERRGRRGPPPPGIVFGDAAELVLKLAELTGLFYFTGEPGAEDEGVACLHRSVQEFLMARFLVRLQTAVPQDCFLVTKRWWPGLFPRMEPWNWWCEVGCFLSDAMDVVHGFGGLDTLPPESRAELLEHSCKRGNVRAVQALAGLRVPDDTFLTMVERNMDALEWLVEEQQQDINTQVPEMGTPLCMACWEGNPDTIERVLELGADPNLPDDEGLTPIFHLAMAMTRADVNLLRSFVDRGADPRALTPEGETLLHRVVGYCGVDPTVLEWLVEEVGLDVEARNENGFTPVLYAAHWGERDGVEDNVRWLVEHAGASLEIMDQEGMNVLMLRPAWGVGLE